MNCADIEKYVIDNLPDDVIIHKYKSYSTNSIYLKFDYGLANSLRISDHEGKKHLAYKFNVIIDKQEFERKENNGFVMLYYPVTKLYWLIEDIIAEREKIMEKAYDYSALVNWKKNNIEHNKGFWTSAKRVKR